MKKNQKSNTMKTGFFLEGEKNDLIFGLIKNEDVLGIKITGVNSQTAEAVSVFISDLDSIRFLIIKLEDLKHDIIYEKGRIESVHADEEFMTLTRTAEDDDVI